jgi:hypothetical protein
MLNQNRADSGIPNRFCLKPSRSSFSGLKKPLSSQLKE